MEPPGSTYQPVLYRLPEAARLLSISPPTLKQWIYNGRILSIRTPGGHHRIPASEIERLGRGPHRVVDLRTEDDRVEFDLRNRFVGLVTGIRIGESKAEISIAIGQQKLMATLTASACRALGLERGMRIYGLVKPSDITIVRA
jgi:molybdopterin-binding protein